MKRDIVLTVWRRCDKQNKSSSAARELLLYLAAGKIGQKAESVALILICILKLSGEAIV